MTVKSNRDSVLTVAAATLVVVAAASVAFLYQRRPNQTDSVSNVRTTTTLSEPAAIAPPPPPGSSLDELASWIRPKASEERWLGLRWLKDLGRAQEIARETNRLVLLWGTNDPPGRC